MAHSIDAYLGTNDEYLDPHCEPCFNGKGLGVQPDCFCFDCYQFLCSGCHEFHENFNIAKDHVILRGADMPKSLADKPARYRYCEAHSKVRKDKFCWEHKILICQSCVSTDHKKCITKGVDVVCKIIPLSATDRLYNSIQILKTNAKDIRSIIEADIGDLEKQRNVMLHETQSIYDRLISKVNKVFKNIQEDVKEQCTNSISLLQKYKESINDIILRIDSSSKEAQRFKEMLIDPKLFLEIQEHTTDTNRIRGEFRRFINSSHRVTPLFESGNLVRDILSASFKFGSVSMTETKFDVNIENVAFPNSPIQPANGTQSMNAHLALQKNVNGLQTENNMGEEIGKDSATASAPPNYSIEIKAVKQNSYPIKDAKDDFFCCISGMVVTKDRRIILTDRLNCKVKLFAEETKFFVSKTFKLMSFVKIPFQPFDVTVANDKESVVTTDYKKLVILDIEKQMTVKSSIELEYDVRGIASYVDKLIVTCPTTYFPSIKLIDQTGRIFWSVSTNLQGQELFKAPNYVSECNREGGNLTVVVSDSRNNTLTLLNAETGEMIATRRLKGNAKPQAICMDNSGLIYVCNLGTHQVFVLSADLSEEAALLALDYGQVIAYDAASNQLIVACSSDREDIYSYQICKNLQDVGRN